MTLVVTVVGGLIVYYVTKWNERPSGERLVYSIEKPSTFNKSGNSLSIQTVYLGNEGNLPSEDIRLVIRFDEGVKIDDNSVEFLSRVPSEYSMDISGTGVIESSIQSLTPGEILRLSFLVSGVPPDQPDVSAKSQGMIGQQVDYVPGQGKPETSMITIIPYIIAIAGIVQILLATILVRKRIRAVRESFGWYDTSPTNTAFLLIHQGLHEDAESLLLEAIRRLGANRYDFGNLALCCALRGEFQLASHFFNAAEFAGGNKHSMAVLNFNKALASYIEGLLSEGDQSLTLAIQGSGQEICRYLAYSSIVRDIRSRSTEIDSRVQHIVSSVEAAQMPNTSATL